MSISIVTTVAALHAAMERMFINSPGVELRIVSHGDHSIMWRIQNDEKVFVQGDLIDVMVYLGVAED